MAFKDLNENLATMCFFTIEIAILYKLYFKVLFSVDIYIHLYNLEYLDKNVLLSPVCMTQMSQKIGKRKHTSLEKSSMFHMF